MPYIKESRRPQLDAVINQLVVSVAEPGDLNYVITRVLLRALGPTEGRRYRDYCTVLGTLSAVDKEMYRRAIAAYEDECIERNGDIPYNV